MAQIEIVYPVFFLHYTAKLLLLRYSFLVQFNNSNVTLQQSISNELKLLKGIQCYINSHCVHGKNV